MSRERRVGSKLLRYWAAAYIFSVFFSRELLLHHITPHHSAVDEGRGDRFSLHISPDHDSALLAACLVQEFSRLFGLMDHAWLLGLIHSQLTDQLAVRILLSESRKVSASVFFFILLPLVPPSCSAVFFKDDNLPFSSLHLRVALDERSGPSFPGWSATCQYTLSEILFKTAFVCIQNMFVLWAVANKV